MLTPEQIAAAIVENARKGRMDGMIAMDSEYLKTAIAQAIHNERWREHMMREGIAAVIARKSE